MGIAEEPCAPEVNICAGSGNSDSEYPGGPPLLLKLLRSEAAAEGAVGPPANGMEAAAGGGMEAAAGGGIEPAAGGGIDAGVGGGGIAAEGGTEVGGKPSRCAADLATGP